MDKETQKKAIIGGLAVLILGAGSYFYLSSGSSSASTVSNNSGPVTERTRTVSKTEENKTRAREKPKTEKAEVAEVRERAEPADRARGPGRERRDNTRKIEKKKEVKPAA